MNEPAQPTREIQPTRVLVWKRLAVGALIVLGLLLGITSVYNSFVNRQTLNEVRHTQQHGSPILQAIQGSIDQAADAAVHAKLAAKAAKASQDQIADCVQPGGECFERGQRQTGKAIVGINQGTLNVVVAALSCQADGISDRAALARCTIERSQP